MLKLQQSEVRDLEILANQGEGGNDHQEKGENHGGVGSLRAGPTGVGRLRAGTQEARSLGGSGPSGVGRMRAGTLEQDHWEDHLQQCHLLQYLLSVPKCNNDLYLSVVVFSRLVCF